MKRVKKKTKKKYFKTRGKGLKLHGRGSPVTPGETESLGHNGLGGHDDQVTRITLDKSGPLVGTLRCPQDSGR